MKKINLTISYEEENVKALRWYLEQKDTKLEDELLKAVDALFNRNVPSSVRNYISKGTEPAEEPPRPRRPKPAVKETTPSPDLPNPS